MSLSFSFREYPNPISFGVYFSPMEGNLGVIFMVVGLAFLTVCLLLPRLRGRRSAHLQREGSFGDASEDATTKLEKLLIDIQDISREHIAKLDTKIRLLSQLLAECDQKKAELEKLLHTNGKAGMSRRLVSPKPRSGEGGSPEGAKADSRPSNPLHDQVYALQDAGKGLDDICGETGLERGEVELIFGLRRMASPDR